MEIIEEMIRKIGTERARKTERVLRALVEVGINLKNCCFDGKENLIISISEIQK